VALNVPHNRIIIADVNPGLMALWRTLQSDGHNFIQNCQSFFTDEHNTADSFYTFRKTFNQTDDQYLKGMIFLYLNRHCFNGLCRFNSKGEFNVPFGKYKKPGFPMVELLHALEVAQRMTIREIDFLNTMNMATEGDVVYCDPPYLPLSDTSNFVGYSKGGFSYDDQMRLKDCAERLRDRGVTVIISNNDTPVARQLYKKADEIHEVQVAKKISCKSDGRKKLGEIIAVYRP
jgi:DNA adenine methylase